LRETSKKWHFDEKNSCDERLEFQKEKKEIECKLFLIFSENLFESFGILPIKKSKRKF